MYLTSLGLRILLIHLSVLDLQLTAPSRWRSHLSMIIKVLHSTFSVKQENGCFDILPRSERTLEAKHSSDRVDHEFDILEERISAAESTDCSIGCDEMYSGSRGDKSRMQSAGMITGCILAVTVMGPGGGVRVNSLVSCA